MEIGKAAASAIQVACKMRVWDTSQQVKCGAFYGTGYPVPMLAEKLCLWKGRERNGTETNTQNGHIVVKNPLAYELPKREVVIKSGRTLYRFTGSYDGQRALTSKVLRLMEQDNLQKDDDNENKER